MRRCDVFFEMRDFRRSGYGQHDRRTLQEPRQRELRDRNEVQAGDADQFLRAGMIRLEQLAAGIGIPGHEADAAPLAVVERFLVAAITE